MANIQRTDNMLRGYHGGYVNFRPLPVPSRVLLNCQKRLAAMSFQHHRAAIETKYSMRRRRHFPFPCRQFYRASPTTAPFVRRLSPIWRKLAPRPDIISTAAASDLPRALLKVTRRPRRRQKLDCGPARAAGIARRATAGSILQAARTLMGHERRKVSPPPPPEPARLAVGGPNRTSGDS